MPTCHTVMRLSVFPVFNFYNSLYSSKTKTVFQTRAGELQQRSVAWHRFQGYRPNCELDSIMRQSGGQKFTGSIKSWTGRFFSSQLSSTCQSQETVLFKLGGNHFYCSYIEVLHIFSPFSSIFDFLLMLCTRFFFCAASLVRARNIKCIISDFPTNDFSRETCPALYLDY